MDLRHLTRNQNKALADLLFATAKAVGAAAMIALFFPSAGQDWSLAYLFGALVAAFLLAALGISIVGRIGEEAQPSKWPVKSKRARR